MQLNEKPEDPKVLTMMPIPQIPATQSLISVLARVISDPSIPIERIERSAALYERAVAREDAIAFNHAMMGAQTELRPVAADANNPQTRSRYATYAALDAKARPIYTKHGFSLSFDTAEGAAEGSIRVVCFVAVGGHSRTYHIDMPADGKGAKGGDVMTKTHATGAGVTYGRRYLLGMIFNLVIGEDDDGNSATAVERISQQQSDDITALIQEVAADKARFLRFFKINTVAELPLTRYAEAVAMLNAKRTQGAPQ